MEKQKQKYKTKLTKNGPLKKKNRGDMEKYLRASIEGSLDQLHLADSPMLKGRKMENKPLLGTWSPGLKRWYNARLMLSPAGAAGTTPAQGSSAGTWSHDIRKGVGLVIKNRHSYHEALKLSSQQSNLYRARGMVEKLNAQEDLEEIMKSARPSFYTLGDFMEPIHHRVTSDEGGSVTEYEEVEEDLRLVMPSAFGSSRHIKDLKKVHGYHSCVNINYCTFFNCFVGWKIYFGCLSR